MQKVIINNTSTGKLLAAGGSIANSFFSRLKGLIGKKIMAQGEGLVIHPCAMVHSIGMKICIDVLFVSISNEIVHIIEKMPPNRISPYIKTAHYVIELPAGQILTTNTNVGHSISIINEQRVHLFFGGNK